MNWSSSTTTDATRVAIKHAPGLWRGRLIVAATSALVALMAAAGQAQAGRSVAAAGAPATCVVHSLPSFIAQGEQFPWTDAGTLQHTVSTAASVADVVEVECNPSIYGTGSKIKLTANQLFSRCKGRLTWYVVDPYRMESGKGVSVELDADGNATVALLAGPECSAGESLITAHMEEEPFETFTTSFTVLPPVTSPPGVYALPAAQVEDALSSGVATIVQAEFLNGSEQFVRIGSEELFHRCRVVPHLHWIRMDRSEETGVAEVTRVQLDNDGNAFVIAIGDSSCAPGTSLIEADLESKPFTTFTTNFTTQPPQPTAEPSFTIEKRQEIAGSSAGFTVAPLKGSVGQTVNYKIIVTNTGTVPETFSEFTDAHCEAIAGGPGSSAVGPGETTTYTCHHALSAPGSYTNEATVTASTVGGTPLTQTSNQVLVETAASAPKIVPKPSSFTIEKLQKIAGTSSGFTAAPLRAKVSDTVDYEIVVRNTGEQTLIFSSFTDAHCDAGSIAGGPGEAGLAPGSSATYTCSHRFTSQGTYVNEASVSASTQSGEHLSGTSNRVIVDVESVIPACESKLAPLRGASGSKRTVFSVRIGAEGIRRITFSLDRHTLKTLAESQAKGGQFTIKIDPRKLSYGKHKVAVLATMRNPACQPMKSVSPFVRTRPAAPIFTG